CGRVRSFTVIEIIDLGLFLSGDQYAYSNSTLTTLTVVVSETPYYA
ncbi:unnamed protein product, partial [Rotaria sp. Silwood1]